MHQAVTCQVDRTVNQPHPYRCCKIKRLVIAGTENHRIPCCLLNRRILLLDLDLDLFANLFNFTLLNISIIMLNMSTITETYCPLIYCLHFCNINVMKNQEEILLKKLAAKIKERRVELNLSQEKLAEICNFDRTYISLLERSKRNPSFLNLKRLSSGLNIELSVLLQDV